MTIFTDYHTVTVPITAQNFEFRDSDALGHMGWEPIAELSQWLHINVGAQALFVNSFLEQATRRWYWANSGTVAVFYFKTKEAAMLFKLTWGGK